MYFKNLIPIEWDSHIEPVPHNPESFFFALNMDQFWNHLNKDFFDNNSFDFGPIPKQNYFPKIDIAETENEFLISAELPGTDDKDIDVTLDNETLTLKGEKRIENEDKQGKFYSRERSYGAFQRSFKVPEGIDQNKIDASFDKGILMVKLPKTHELKKEVKKIAINH